MKMAFAARYGRMLVFQWEFRIFIMIKDQGIPGVYFVAGFASVTVHLFFELAFVNIEMAA